MKLSVRLYRTVTVPTDHIAGVVGLDDKGVPTSVLTDLHDAQRTRKDQKAALANLEFAVRKEFWPFARGIRFFFDPHKTVVGVEAMAFDVSEVNTAMAGLIDADPAVAEDIARLDGALESELGRMGLTVDFDDFTWRLAYEVKGN
jgi:hypothetical protein